MLLYSRCPLGYKQCRIRLTLKLSLYCWKLVQKIFEIIFFLLYLMWFFFLVWFAFLCGCLKIMCSRAIHICAYECIQAFVSVCLWKNWLNYVNNKITTVGHHFIGFRWQTDHQSFRCFSLCLAGKATDGLKWCCSICSEHTVVVNVAIRNSPQKTEWSTLSNMMQHSSLSTLWIWVMFFPHTLQRMHNSSGLFCAVLCVFFVFSVFQQITHS